MDLFCHDYVSKENALQAFKLIICGWCCKGPSLTDVGAVTWVPASGEEGLDADLIRGETPAGRPRAYSRHWAQTSAGGAAGAGRGAGARKEGGLEGKLGLI